MEIRLHVPRLPPLQNLDESIDSRSILYLEDETLNLLGDCTSIISLTCTDPNLANHCVGYAKAESIDNLEIAMNTLDGYSSEVPNAYGTYGLALSLQHDRNLMPIASFTNTLCYSLVVHEKSIPTPSTKLQLLMPHLHGIANSQKVIRAMERIASHLLSGTLIWSDRAISLTWRNKHEVAYVSPSVSFGVITPDTVVSINTIPSKAIDVPQFELSTSSIIEGIIADMEVQSNLARRIISTMVDSLFATSERAHHVPRGLLLSGPPGVGKSHFVNLLARCSKPFEMHLISAADLFQTQVGQSEALLIQAFNIASSRAPCVLVIEEIDAIASQSTVALERSLLGVLLACFDLIHEERRRVFVIATTNRLDVVDPAIRAHSRFVENVELRPPTQRERMDLLSLMCRRIQTTTSILEFVSDRTTGFVGADLLHLVREATLFSCNERSAVQLDTMAPWEHALSVVRPSILQDHRHNVSAATERPLLFGMKHASQIIQVSLLDPLIDSSPYRAMGILPPRGILLTGPSGVGKSQLLAAIAHEVGQHATCIPVRCTDLVTKVVGGTEKALAALFATARAASPCVLLFDQIESIAPIRGFDTSTEQTFDRVLSLLLLEMDGFTSSASASEMQQWTHADFVQQHVVLVATATSAKQLDPSVLRPGRFDIELPLVMPDEVARHEALLYLCSVIPVDLDKSGISSMAELATIFAKKTQGLTIGQLNAIFQDAAMFSLRQSLEIPSVHVEALELALSKLMGNITEEDDLVDAMNKL